MNTALLIDNVYLSINNKEILKGVYLDVKVGEVVTIMGPNGAGKTTLLKTAMGLIKPTKGSVYLFNDGYSKRKGLIGYIPQNLGLVNNLDTISNIMLGALHRMPKINSILGYYPKPIIEEAYELMKRLKIDNLANTKVSKLSGGEKQKVAIARTLIQKPSIIFADEMASNLDLKYAHEIMSSLLKLRRENNLTLVMTHHNPEFAKMYSEVVYLMKDGRIVDSVKASNLDESKLVDLYDLKKV